MLEGLSALRGSRLPSMNPQVSEPLPKATTNNIPHAVRAEYDRRLAEYRDIIKRARADDYVFQGERTLACALEFTLKEALSGEWAQGWEDAYFGSRPHTTSAVIAPQVNLRHRLEVRGPEARELTHWVLLELQAAGVTHSRALVNFARYGAYTVQTLLEELEGDSPI